jgi:hypothetical protein
MAILERWLNEGFKAPKKNGGNGHGVNKGYNPADTAGLKPKHDLSTWSN